MKKTGMIRSLVLSLLISGSTLAQATEPTQKMSVNDRLAKARAAKADKRTAKVTGNDTSRIVTGNSARTDQKIAQGIQPKATPKLEKATPADYKTPIDKSQHGPNGEAIHAGARGGKYYINKNGNKTYLSSNL
ncbi:hypothetical protein [Spirosoma validum]|uniref:PBCV-specific basic adaptor domain-containing protein n=1 Tax=Spirosoma validum TaxID=2771355 RepID=A0A927B5L8_9BACT|nr:hypothetical protein [Spirosoma validum]MBD2755773.1 hypothetical protein [Spirosoma validum]